MLKAILAKTIAALALGACIVAVPAVAQENSQFGGHPAQEGAEQSRMFPQGQKPVLVPEGEDGAEQSEAPQNKGFLVQPAPVYIPTLMCCDTVMVPGAWVPVCPMVIQQPVGSICQCRNAFGPSSGVGVTCIR